MRLKRGIILLLLPLLLLGAGCWDRKEVEDQFYVIMMGMDREESGSLLVTAQVATVQMLSAGTLAAPVRPITPTLAATLLTARAETITQAIYILNGGLSRRLDLRHLRAIVVGEELARSGLEPVVLELLRNPLSRGTALFVQAQGRAHDVLTALKPVGELNPARMTEGYMLQAKQLHMGPPMRLHHFTSRLAALGGDPYLPVMAINAGVGGPGILPAQPLKGSAPPGELPRGGGNPVEFVGTAIYRADQLVGMLDVDETQLLLALRGEMGKAYVTFTDPQSERPVTMRFQQENLPQTETGWAGSRPRIQVKLKFEGELLASPGGTDYAEPKVAARLERAAAEEAERTARRLLEKLKSWRADPVGFGHMYRGQFPSWEAFVEFDWPQQLPDLQVDVKAEMRLRRYGLLLGGGKIRDRK